jgi:hypothetical protein
MPKEGAGRSADAEPKPARLTKEGGEAAGFSRKPRAQGALEADANRRMIGMMDETARAGHCRMEAMDNQRARTK